MRSARLFWLGAALAALLACSFGIREVRKPSAYWTSPDADTRTIYQKIQERGSALSWFATDWPLENGFYRPVSTLTFEADAWYRGKDLGSWRWTNLLLGFAACLALLWFVWELTRSRALAGGAGVLFGGIQSGLWQSLGVQYLGFLAIFGTVALAPAARGEWRKWLLVGSVVWLLSADLGGAWLGLDNGGVSFAERTLGWPPGRTAVVMTAFCLVSLASYCRFERDGLVGWWFASLVALLLALGSYEQAVVGPACLLGCALVLRMRGVETCWWPHIVAWVVTIAFVVLHRSLLDSETSYRLQQVRPLWGGIRDLMLVAFPSLTSIRLMPPFWTPEVGPFGLLLGATWRAIAEGLFNVSSLVAARRDWALAGFGLLGSVGAYSILAFQHPFGHYFYLSAALRALLWLALIRLVVKTAFSGGELRGLSGH
ncbi:MAG: hypothetical protein AKCLJLPJ_01380 [Fimbriimonadales bacterium]|nr:hypothetical protein [Fimbriimonadales bacterium]